MPQREPPGWHSDMQLPGKLLLSAAALLLLSLAFRFYRSRSLPPGKIPPGEQRENRDGAVRRRRRRQESGNGLGMRPAGLRCGEEEEEGEEEGSELGRISREASLGAAGNERELGGKPGIESEREAGVELGRGPGRRTGGELGKESGKQLGRELGKKLGSKVGKEPGSGLGKELGSERGKELGEESGKELGRELGSKVGKELGSKVGKEPGKEPGSGLQKELGRKLGSKVGKEPGKELGKEPESGIGKQLGSELGKGPGSELGKEQGSQPGSNLGNNPGRNPGSKLVTRVGNESGSERENEPGIELGNKLGNKLGIKSGIELGSEQGIKAGSELGSELGSEEGVEVGNEVGSKLGNLLGSELGSEAGVELGSEPGISLGSKLGSKAGIEVGSEPGILLGREPGVLLGSEPGSKAGVELGSETGISLGSESGISVGSDLGISLGSEPGISVGSEPGISVGSEPGISVGSESGISLGSEPGISVGSEPGISVGSEPGGARSLRVTSSLALLLTAREEGSDTSHSFSSVAEIQVEEKVILERRDKDGAEPAGPGLRSKVYDYFVQSVSESVSRRTRLPFVPAGTSGAQRQSPASGIPAPDPSAEPRPGTQSPPEPPPPGTLGIAPQPLGEEPRTARDGERDRPSGSGLWPLPGTQEGTDPPEAFPPSQAHLGNSSELLRWAGAPRDAALQAMSRHLLQVLRSPDIYGRLNAGERELLPALRSRGRPRLVVADIPPAQPGHRRGRLCYYDEDGDRWLQLCQLPADVSGRGCAVCSMFNYLFLLPGWEGAGRERRPSRRLLCYDPLDDTWCDLCPLRQARPRCRLVALDGHLYAIGGECLATVERYDPRSDRWGSVAALPGAAFAVSHAAAACDGRIFVTGGSLRWLLLSYDARRDAWAASPALGDAEGAAELVSAHGFLYRFQLRRGAGLSVWRCGAAARLWHRCGGRALPELGPAGLSCAALGGLVHCLGRRTHLRFLAEPAAPRFAAEELRPFPEPHGSLLPAALVLLPQ